MSGAVAVSFMAAALGWRIYASRVGESSPSAIASFVALVLAFLAAAFF